MTKQQLEADMGEARESSWVERTSAEASPALTWEAVRAAIFKAGEGQGSMPAQDAAKALFFNLNQCDLEHANAALDQRIRSFENLRSAFGGNNKPEYVAASLKDAKRTLNEIMLGQSAARAA